MDSRERRIFPRFNLQVDVSFRILDDEGTQKGETRNISSGGVCLISYDPVKVSDLLELEVSLPEETPPMRVTGRAVWVNEFVIGEHSGNRYDVGVEFVNPDDKTLSVLTNYLFKIGE